LWAVRMGRESFSDFDLQVVTASEMTPEQAGKNQIVFGEVARQPLTVELLLLNQNQPSTAGLYNAIGEKDSGVISQFISPVDGTSVITLVYGDTFNNYIAVSKTFGDPTLMPSQALYEVSKNRIVLRMR
jgi:hypothetical protein